MPDYDEVKRQVDEIQDMAEGLTEWEDNFIKSIIGQYKMRGFLSPKQIAQVEKIYRERVPNATLPSQRRESPMTTRIRTEGRDDYTREYGRTGWRNSLRDRYGDKDDI